MRLVSEDITKERHKTQEMRCERASHKDTGGVQLVAVQTSSHTKTQEAISYKISKTVLSTGEDTDTYMLSNPF